MNFSYPQFMGTWKGSEISSPPAVTLATWNLFIIVLSRIRHVLRHSSMSFLASSSLMSSVCFSRNSGLAMWLPNPAARCESS